MAVLEKMLISMPLEAAKVLSRTGSYSLGMFPEYVPQEFLDRIKTNVSSRTGIQDGMVMCVSRVGGKRVSIDQLTDDDGHSLPDLLSIVIGDVLMEFSFPADQVLSIRADVLIRLCEEAKEYGADDEDLLNDLDDSLSVGVGKAEQGSTDVYSFLSKLTASQFVRGYIIDDNWEQKTFRTSSDKTTFVTTLKLFA